MATALLLRGALAARRFATTARPLSSAVLMNGDKLNFDGSLDYSRLKALTHLTQHGDTAPSELAGRAAGAEILITKVRGSVHSGGTCGQRCGNIIRAAR